MNYLVLHRSMRFAHDDKNYACLNNVSSPGSLSHVSMPSYHVVSALLPADIKTSCIAHLHQQRPP